MNGSNIAYRHVLDYIIDHIKSGEIKKEIKLPTERELAELLGYSRATIREAYMALDMIGIVEQTPGLGTIIKKDFDNWTVDAVNIIFKLSGTGAKEVYEFRKMIEIETATLAAEKITDEEIAQLTEYYEKMVGSSDEKTASFYDKKFHNVIARATKNSIIMNAYNAMSPMLDLFTVDIRKVVLEREPEGILESMHENIFEAIIARDKERARRAMKVHMNMISKHFA
ncbi:MAG: FadR family transcriptional regulator [Tissierellales bacterium]|nr:FadR family transcriptional regulator [Tissierellales bacterium]MBN2826363.1 FadR family transcriptional regulator [Tissierellales bacterium]